MKLLTTAAVTLALLTPAASWAAPSPVQDLSTVQSDGAPILKDRVLIAAPRSLVWKAFVDVATIKASGVPAAWVDLRDGGSIEEAFDPKAQPGDANNIRHLIVVQIPEHLLVTRNQNVPARVPGREAFKQVVQVIEINDVGQGMTELTITGYGYGTNAEFQALYGFFHPHNAELLAEIKAGCEAAARH